MKKIIIIIFFYSLTLFICGLGNEDYYTRIDALLGQTMEVMTKANTLPIITGAIDEQNLPNTEKQYYQAATKLADQQKNYAWTTYQNSNKTNSDYLARKTELIARDKLGSGEKAAFIDQFSGEKYLNEENRYKRKEFFKQFQKGIGSADIYIDNICMPEKTLADLFDIQLPEMPGSDDYNFKNNLPKLKIDPLQEWKKEIMSSLREETLNEQLRSHWQVIMELQNGEIKTSKGSNIIKVKNNQTFNLGIKIIDPDGKYITKENELPGYLPYITTLPLPEGEQTRLNISSELTIRTSDFQESSDSSFAQGISFKNKTLPQVQPGKSPLIINYSIAKDIDVVELNIRNSKGELIYTLKESKPDPRAPIPFVWPGTEINKADHTEKTAGAGNYMVNLLAYDKQNNLYSTPAKLTSVITRQEKKQIDLQAKKIANNGSGKYYGTATLETRGTEQYGLEKIYLWLHGSEGTFRKPLSSVLYLSFANFSAEHSTLLAETSTLTLGKTTTIKVELCNSFGQPIINAPVSLYSRRNNRRICDYFTPETQRTDLNGVASFKLSSDIPGETEIFALSDMIWVNQKPLVIKVVNKNDL